MCVVLNLGDSACTLSGLTITNGYAGSEWDDEETQGGGVYCSGALPVVTNCLIVGNSAYEGGGMSRGTVNNCVILNNSAVAGGGLFYSDANDCTIRGNTAGYSAGGAYGENTIFLNHCNIIGNTAAENAGGVWRCTVNNSIIRGNKAGKSGGGICEGTANNCILTDNTANYYGGGASWATLNNCTITRNFANHQGGGSNAGMINNSIVWYNKAAEGNDIYISAEWLEYLPDYVGMHYSCSPDVPHGVDGNITNAPVLISASHIAVDSPCIGAASAEYTSGTDIDGDAWQNPPSIGCDEFAGSEGSSVVQIQCSTSRSVVGYSIDFEPEISGSVSMYVWDFGDGSASTNSFPEEHAWSSSGAYEVVLTAYNGTDGISATQTVQVVSQAAAAVYVASDGNDENDGLSWATAKATIQAGVDMQQVLGGTVWVSNGTYAVTNEIVVSRPIRVQSIAGPESTMVDGLGQSRCFNLGDSSCVISGLTITNGYSETGAGGGIWCDGFQPQLTNCFIVGNSAAYGGGVRYGTADHCTISGNVAQCSGGGMFRGVASYCQISDNVVSGEFGAGGGLYVVSADHCTITRNRVEGRLGDGGGMWFGAAANCIITDNVATNGDGGGVYSASNDDDMGFVNPIPYYGPIQNCLISGNSANNGGGIDAGVIQFINCTIVNNTALRYGGGVFGRWPKLLNSIVWNNEALYGDNDDIGGYSRVNEDRILYTCSLDLIHGVNNNITNAPLFASITHLAEGSPCIGAGSVEYAAGTDIGGVAWLNPPSMGCAEYAEVAEGPLQVSIECDNSLPLTNRPVRFKGNVIGAASMHVLDFGDGYMVTNQQFAINHQWSSPGTYSVILTAYNDSFPDGISVTQRVEVVSPEMFAVYVALDGDDAADGLSWATAKATLQAGVDAQEVIGGWVLVSNGVYAVTNAITVGKEIVIRGVGGPEQTVVDGQGMTQCFILANVPCVVEYLCITNGFAEVGGGGIDCVGLNPSINNCIITGNRTEHSGGGIYAGSVNNCIVSDNHAEVAGGGIYFAGSVNNCIITDNHAGYDGGGIYCFAGTAANNCVIYGNNAERNGGGILGVYSVAAYNCTIIGNSAGSSGGGVYSCEIVNSIVWYNSATQTGDNWVSDSILTSCSPDLTHGVDGNITNAPAFVDAANGDYHLLSSSPCIN
ncbi:MAG: right-handed parallel beta-helix repeat-containing protein, partial [Pontiellaceae bacterium]|nr:right-handed parallel beta-helix repeat-containing protein [Pontiellaceae bacterium]